MLLTDKQREFVRHAHCRWNFKGGATRSGKTYLDFKWVIPMRIRERIGKDGLVVLLGVTKSTIERNVLEPMRNIYGELLVGSISSDNTVRLFGEKCYALGAEKISQVSKIRGSSIKYCYGDEVADWSEDVFALLKSRLDKEYSCFDGTFNPSFPNHWLKRFLDSGADIYSQTYTIFDNPFLPEKVVEALCQEYKGTVLFNRYILGEWKKAEGLVYPMFNESFLCEVEPTKETEYLIAIDYGTINPTCFGLWELKKGEAVMVKEYYHNSREQGVQLTDEEYYEQLKRFADGLNIKCVIIDPSAASFKETIRRHKVFKIYDADNSVLDGIRFCGTLLGQGRVKINKTCTNTINEFYAYSWDDKSERDAVIKENDHSMDQMRYALYTFRHKYFAPEKDKKPEQKRAFPQLWGKAEDKGRVVVV